MGKILKSITVNEEDWTFLQSLRINLSEEIRNFLQNLRISRQNNINSINIQLEYLKLQKNLEAHSKIQSDIKTCQDRISQYEEGQKELVEQKLKEEKERIEKETHCLNCKKVLTKDNSRTVREGVVLCRSCCLDNIILGKYLKG